MDNTPTAILPIMPVHQHPFLSAGDADLVVQGQASLARKCLLVPVEAFQCRDMPAPAREQQAWKASRGCWLRCLGVGC